MSKALLQDLWYDAQHKRQFQILALVAGLIVAGAAGWMIYSSHTSRKVQEAHKAFTDGVSEFEAVLQRPVNSQNWSSVIELFGAAYDRYKSSVFAPFMLAYKAQALSYSGEKEAALDAMTKALASLDKQDPLYGFYAAKLALMKIDSSDEAIKAEGLKELENLANDLRNPAKDMATYYLGQYLASEADEAGKEKARSLWSTLIAQAGTDSVWAAMAQHQLSLL